MLFSFIGLAIHRLIGIPVFSAVLENQIWILLVFAIVTILAMFSFDSQRSIIQITQLSCAIAGFTVLIYHGMVMLNSLFSGMPIERFVYYQRAFGDYYWFYWAIVGILGFLPTIYSISRIRTSLWLSFSTLLGITLTAAFYLRANFALHYSDTLPSSWSQFFWPF